MKHTIAQPLKEFISNMTYFASRKIGINKPWTSILCYHSISDTDTKYCIPLSEMLLQFDKIRATSQFIEAKNIWSLLGKKQISTTLPSVLMTIDDGYKDVLSLLPYMIKYGIKPLLFVMSHPEKVNRTELGNQKELLSVSDIKLLMSYGWTIGSHSATHADFSALSHAELAFEIAGSKKALEQKLGSRIDYFAYPKGVYDARILDAVKNAGYKAAFSTEPGCILASSERWHLPRTVIKKTHSVDEIPAAYSPTTYRLRNLVDRLPLGRLVNI